MALNKHMALAVAEINGDIAQLEQERLKARTCKEAAGLKLDIKNLKAAAGRLTRSMAGRNPQTSSNPRTRMSALPSVGTRRAAMRWRWRRGCQSR